MLSERNPDKRSKSGNGRMYDPLVGRFLSADNYVQDPTNSQHYNRYSYGLNNPLKYNDPSGWLFHKAEEYDPIAAADAQFASEWSGFILGSRRGGGGVLPDGFTTGSNFGQQLYNAANRLLGNIPVDVVYSLTNINYSNCTYDFTFARNDKATQYCQQLANFIMYHISASAKNIGSGKSFNLDDDPIGQRIFNEDKTINYLKNNFILPYGAGQCINHMVSGLIEGGITGLIGNKVIAACLYGPILMNLGFAAVNRTDNFYKGDIAIIQGYAGGTYCNGSGIACGHIQMYDGKQWLSDFPQTRPFWPGKGYADAIPSPSFEILHWGGN